MVKALNRSLTFTSDEASFFIHLHFGQRNALETTLMNFVAFSMALHGTAVITLPLLQAPSYHLPSLQCLESRIGTRSFMLRVLILHDQEIISLLWAQKENVVAWLDPREEASSAAGRALAACLHISHWQKAKNLQIRMNISAQDSHGLRHFYNQQKEATA